MATISHNDLAPSGTEVTYSLASAEPFSLKGKATHVVAVPDADAGEERAAYDAVVANAEAHPWLKVDRSDEVPAADAEDAPVEIDFPKTAIDASLDQDDVAYEGDGEIPIAETLAADDAQGDEPIVIDDEPTHDEPVVPAEDN